MWITQNEIMPRQKNYMRYYQMGWKYPHNITQINVSVVEIQSHGYSQVKAKRNDFWNYSNIKSPDIVYDFK